MSAAAPVLEPGATIGILGGGQLGRMLALAAARLGFKCHVFAPEPDSPAFDVVHRVTCADYADTQALDRFADDVDVVTYEFENVPAETATFLAARVPVLPDPQSPGDRPRIGSPRKTFVAGLGIGTAPFAAVDAPAELAAALERIGRPAVLKTRRFGYDGKGQATIGNGADPDAAWREVGGQPCILEAFVPFEREISVVAARGARRRGRMLRRHRERAPRPHPEDLARARRGAPMPPRRRRGASPRRSRDKFDYVGVLAVEMFVLRATARLLVNEIAPRVHNSGHWTIDGASVSQFEQHIRAVAGWPLAKPVRHGRVEMINLIGGEVEDYRALARRARRRRAPLRQGRGAARPQDGACDAGLCRVSGACELPDRLTWLVDLAPAHFCYRAARKVAQA